MKNINLMSIDLELNQPSGTIIQVGGVVGNLQTGEVFEEFCFDIFTEQEIAEHITKITGIKQEHVNNGKDLKDCYEWLKNTHKYYNCFRNLLQWGQGDSECLKESLKLDNELFVGGRRTIDAKNAYINYRWANGLSHQAGLAKAMTKLDLKFEGKKHNAMDDAKNTFIIYRKLLQLMSGE